MVKPRAECLFHWQQGGGFEAYSDKVTRRSVSVGVIMRGGHCLKVWTKKQQVVSLSTAESELYAPVKTRVRGIGNPERGEGLGHCMCQVNRRNWARQNAPTCRTCGYTKPPSQKIRHEEGGYERETRRLDDETRALNSWGSIWSVKGYIARNWGAQSEV